MDKYPVRKDKILTGLEKIKNKIIRAKEGDWEFWGDIASSFADLSDLAYEESHKL